MKTERVYSKNATYQMFEVLATNRNKRYKRRAFLVEGVRNINAAVRYGWGIESFLFPGDTQLSSWAADMLSSVSTQVNYQLSPALMAEISGKEDTSELLAIVRMREDDTAQIKLSATPLLALFDRPSNRGNLGTIIRSCDALGVDGLLLTGHGVDLYEAEVIGASMGSFFKVPTVRLSDNADIEAYLSSLKTEHPALRVIGTTAHREHVLFEQDLRGPVLFMIGNETEGLNRHFKALCDALVTIPMVEGCDATSLNVGCAATVLFAEALRQRKYT